MSESSLGRSRVRRLRRGVVLVCIGCVLLGALLGSVTVAIMWPQVDTSSIDNAQRVIRTTVLVSEQPTRVVHSVTGSVIVPASQAVSPNNAGAGGSLVVTARPRAVGDVIHTGEVVAEVSNRPVFAFPVSVPLFRDLLPGATGSDVSSVQQMLIDLGLLGGTPSGKVDSATQAAFTKLYKNAGYSVPLLGGGDDIPAGASAPTGKPGLLLSDTISVPRDGLKVVSAAGVGQVIDSDHPLVVVETAPAVVVARGTMLQMPSFPVGSAVTVQVGYATPVASTVLTVSEFQSGEDGSSPGYDLTVALPEGVDPVVTANQPVIVVETNVPPNGPAVPLSAIRTDNQGAYVYKAADTKTNVDERVTVRVVSQANGYAILSDSETLPVGTEIVLSGERV